MADIDWFEIILSESSSKIRLVTTEFLFNLGELDGWLFFHLLKTKYSIIS